MLITTPEELRVYLPTHVMDNLATMYGVIDNSEKDFLLDKIGKPLYNAVQAKYDELNETEKATLVPQDGVSLSPWMYFITLCQRPVAFDAASRDADLRVVSVNESSINGVDTEGYSQSTQENLKAYKLQCVKEAHSGINRLLTELEDWAEDVAKADTDSMTEDELAAYNEKSEILKLWKESKYYYRVTGLLVQTARQFNEFVDIYDSREKFVSLRPDLWFVQDFLVRPQLGNLLTDDLIQKVQSAGLNDTEKELVRYIRLWMCLAVEFRNKMFKRAEAKDESLMARDTVIKYIIEHYASLNETAIATTPFYSIIKEKKAADDAGTDMAEPTPQKMHRTAAFFTPFIQ